MYYVSVCSGSDDDEDAVAEDLFSGVESGEIDSDFAGADKSRASIEEASKEGSVKLAIVFSSSEDDNNFEVEQDDYEADLMGDDLDRAR